MRDFPNAERASGSVRSPTIRRKTRRSRRFATWCGGLAFAPILAGAVAEGTGAPPGPAVAAALLLWLVAADFFMRRPGGTPALTYHSVSAAPGWLPWAHDIAVSLETFDRHLATLARMGIRTVDTAEFAQARVRGEAPEVDVVMLHLDDGYLDNWAAAAPILRRHGMRATTFVSLDFIEPDQPLRPTIEDDACAVVWTGYMTWRELRKLDAEGVIGVEAHGVDHARVPIGPRVVDHVSAENWRRLAWVQWAASPGPKYDWHRHAFPTAAPIGTPVLESGGALACRAWRGGGFESEAEYRKRVRGDLKACLHAFERELGRNPRVFCWPQNLTSEAARDLAEEVGFIATTGGLGENRANEDPRVISRVHVGDRVLGFRWPWAEGVALCATVRTFQGNYYWFGVLIVFGAIRRLVKAVSRLGKRE